jgi:hypothetical protein
MLADFTTIIGVTSVPRIWQNKQLPNVPLSIIITKKIFRKNVTLINFMSRIAIIIARR